MLAINTDPSAPIFQAADVGIVADWRDALPLLVAELRACRVLALTAEQRRGNRKCFDIVALGQRDSLG